MTQIRDYRLTTQRLAVNEWHSFSQTEWAEQHLAAAVCTILTENVTRSLPPAWQGSYTLARANEWITERDNEGVTLAAIGKDDKKIIGLVVLFELDDSGDLRLGYMLDESVWGRGYASELVKGFVSWCRRHKLRSVTGGVELDNIASRRVLEKCGFVAEPATDETTEQLFTLDLS